MTAISAKRSFVVVVVLGVESMLQIEQKNCSKSDKKLQNEWKMFAIKIASNWTESKDFKMDIAWPWATYCGLLWPFMVLYDLVWYFIILYGLIMVLYGLFYSLIRQNIDLIGIESSFLVVIDPNSFGLVFHRKNFLKHIRTALNALKSDPQPLVKCAWC